MDALAGLAFGIIVVNVIRGLGVKQPGNVARCTVKAGVLSSFDHGGDLSLLSPSRAHRAAVSLRYAATAGKCSRLLPGTTGRQAP